MDLIQWTKLGGKQAETCVKISIYPGPVRGPRFFAEQIHYHANARTKLGIEQNTIEPRQSSALWEPGRPSPAISIYHLRATSKTQGDLSSVSGC